MGERETSKRGTPAVVGPAADGLRRGGRRRDVTHASRHQRPPDVTQGGVVVNLRSEMASACVCSCQRVSEPAQSPFGWPPAVRA